MSEPSLEKTHRFVRGLAAGFGAVEVGAAFGGVAELDDGHDVQDPVDLAIPWRRIASCPSRSVPKRPLPRMDSSLVMISIVTDRLWGSIPMTTRGAASFMVSSELEPVGVVELGGQRYFELGQTPLEPLPPWRRPGMRRPNESHTGVSSRNESDNPERLDRASSDTGHGVNETSSRLACGRSPTWEPFSHPSPRWWPAAFRPPPTAAFVRTRFRSSGRRWFPGRRCRRRRCRRVGRVGHRGTGCHRR